MIPIEKLLEVENKARDWGYHTTIENGGQNFKCMKSYYGVHNSGEYSLKYNTIEIIICAPEIQDVKIEDFEAHFKEQDQLLELAKMLHNSR